MILKKHYKNMLLNKVIIFIINSYQKLPFRSNTSCRFHPTCSEYGKDLFLKHSFLCAFILTSKRIIRCNPFVEHQVDLPPQKGCSPCLCKVK